MTRSRNGTASPAARAQFGAGLDPDLPADLVTAAELPTAKGPPPPPPAERARAVAVEISAVYDGWPLVLRADLAPEKIPKYLARLEACGYHRPPLPTALTPNGEPICPKHRVAMTLHEKQGESWYSHKLTDAGGRECWCKGRPGGDSAGWAIDAAL